MDEIKEADNGFVFQKNSNSQIQNCINETNDQDESGRFDRFQITPVCLKQNPKRINRQSQRDEGII